MLLLWGFPQCVRAAAGDVLSGEYVLIVNTDLSDSTYHDGSYVDMPQKSGTIYFDASAGSPSNNSVNTANTSSLSADVSSVSSDGKPQEHSRLLLSNVASYTAGQTRSISGKTFTLAAIGEHCLIWMDDSIKSGYEAAGKNIYTAGAAAAQVYDNKSYPVIEHFDATNLLYYADGSGKLSILLESGISSGYFDYTDMFSDNGNVTAIHIKGSDLPSDFSGFGPLFAHECQHAINYCMEEHSEDFTYMSLWLNEALSVAAMDTYTRGHDGNGWLNGMINTSDYLRNGRSFVYSSYPGYTESNYSMPFLFLRYLNTQANRGYSYQSDFYSKFYHAMELGSAYSTPWRRYDANRVEYVMRQYSPISDWDFKQALVNFYIAIQVQANEGVYGFYGDPVISRKVSGFPIYGGTSGSSVDIEKCGAIMVKTINGSFTVPSDAGEDIVFVAFSPSAYTKGLTTAGTEQDPHIIADAEDLSYIWDAEYNHDFFRIASDFVADEAYYDFWVDNFYNYYMDANQRHWPDFYGVLDGNGYSISGLKRPLSKSNYGLIKDISLECELIFDSQLLGAVACGNYGSIEDCSVHGSITIPDEISSYYNDQYAWIGGIAGDMRNSTGDYPSHILRCMSDISISGELDVYKYFYIGGIVGSSSVNSGEYDMSDCYSAASLDLSIKDKLPGAVILGGLAGDDGDALTKNSYSVANVNFTNNNGGNVTDKLYMGRAIGRASYYGTFQSVYSLSGFASCGGSYTPETIISLNEESMGQQNSYTGFDFASVWMMPETGSAYAYPTLRPRLSPAVPTRLGDVTQDGVVSVADAVRVCRHIARLDIFNSRISQLADVNGDGSVDISDLLLICRYVAGIIRVFPIE